MSIRSAGIRLKSQSCSVLRPASVVFQPDKLAAAWPAAYRASRASPERRAHFLGRLASIACGASGPLKPNDLEPRSQVNGGVLRRSPSFFLLRPERLLLRLRLRLRLRPRFRLRCKRGTSGKAIASRTKLCGEGIGSKVADPMGGGLEALPALDALKRRCGWVWGW